MEVFPKDAYDRLEYSKVLEQIAGHCLSSLAKDELHQGWVSTEFSEIERALKETEEIKKLAETGGTLPMMSFESVSADIILLQKQGFVLDIEAIQRIYFIITIGVLLKQFANDNEIAKAMPLTTEIIQGLSIEKTLVDEIDRVLDSDGNVKPDASPELLKITKQVKAKERESDKVFLQEVEFYKTKGFLGDSYETLRNGRRVLTVLTEHKRKIPGIIHDESATGKTVYIEPEKVMALNIEIHNLYAEQKAEIYKIIRDLCEFIRPYSNQIQLAQSILVRLDVIRAKSLYALNSGGVRPRLQKKPCLQILQGYNPVLKLRNKGLGLPVVPFDLNMLGQNRVLILSGPNAGGKSVVMKSVGLLQLMVQSGILVPVHENSLFGVFSKIFVDIGDQQSLEDDLSTYSSHLRNMKVAVENTSQDTLILFDEFGAGTDPKVGGAMAEAVLFHINQMKCYGVITTHYSNLKFFAFKMPGLLNGSMEFDKNKLVPTFQLHVGKPGSSFAFEIAKKTGLPEKVIDYAKKKSGKNELAIDDMLISLMDEKKEYEKKFNTLIEKQDKLDRLIKSYEQLMAEMEIKKKKLKLEVKENAAFMLQVQKQALHKAMQAIQKAKDAEEIKNMSQKIKSEEEKVAGQLKEIKQEVYHQEIKKVSRPIEVGDFVRMRSGSTIGEVLRVKNNKAEIQMGIMKLSVPLIELEMAKEPIQTSSGKSINTDKINKNLPESMIDLREYTKQDAMRLLDEFLDRSLLHNMYELKIIHGQGTGVLRKEVWKVLKQYKDIKKYWHPEMDQGGDGVTLVQF